jgi:hypothetical protein
MTFKTIIGSRAEVWHGTAKHTSGGLTKSHLMKNKSGRIVSRKKHFSAKKDNRLVKAGFKTKKGHFGFVKVGSKKNGRKHMKGGMMHDISSGADLSLDMKSLGSTGVQIRAGQGGGSPYGNNFVPANLKGDGISGAGITDFGNNSTSVQMRAGMSGGKTRRHKMRGGTTKPFADVSMNSPLNRALNA